MLSRITLAAHAALIALAAPAAASDILAPGFDWTGLYAGVNAGIAANQSSFDSSIRDPGNTYDTLKNTLDGSQSGLMGGGMLGYALQTGRFVVGAEADLNYLGVSDTRSTLEDYDLYNATRKTTIDASWLATLRGRAGLAAGGFLLYGTAGLAAGNMEATATIKAIDLATGDVAKWKGSTEATNWGWTAGAGLEYGISNVSFGLEYLWVDLGTADWSGDLSGTLDDAFGNTRVKGEADYQFSITRATAKLHF
ncbi:hypothetical protein DK847_10145 [Aestuariivirga litoralis]|uniref:Outer membrane protein beta-barrel domain-containing protein n=1 Tax=Aestuariivirga litoralis TaxID=2650924 RepID=A0A2W2AMV6_9HYPH|nr:outer membrane beta-barrel protein [Aestuariivirga litoralis]PZF76825.1 hypothetical protein DK847_10145 [Aestuariivirga litoralis]